MLMRAENSCLLVVDLQERLRGDVEVRLTEGLTDAYLSNSRGVRYRSLEFLVRACLPF